MNAKWACFKGKEPHLGPRPSQLLLHLNFGVSTVEPQSEAVLCVGFESRLCLLSFKWIIRFPLRIKQQKNSQDLPCLGIFKKQSHQHVSPLTQWDSKKCQFVFLISIENIPYSGFLTALVKTVILVLWGHECPGLLVCRDDSGWEAGDPEDGLFTMVNR